MRTTKCFICKALVPDIEGPVSSQSYIPQSAGCWQLYTEVLAKEYGEWQYPDIHRLTVDCYAAQHPTLEPNPKSAQSVTVHLIGIYFFTQQMLPSKEVTQIMGKLVERHKGKFSWMAPPENLGNMTITEVHAAQTISHHQDLVYQWAAAIWSAWSKYHPHLIDLASNIDG